MGMDENRKVQEVTQEVTQYSSNNKITLLARSHDKYHYTDKKKSGLNTRSLAKGHRGLT